jgi:putative FmdB family regulatory protein
MPLYTYQCECGSEFDRFLKLASYKEPQTCECGKIAEKKLTFCSVSVMEAYQSPVTGEWIETPRQGREQETKAAQDREKDFDKMLDKSAEKSAVEAWQALPSETKKVLEKAS